MAETDLKQPEEYNSDDDDTAAEEPKGILSRFGLKVAQMGFSRDVLMNHVRVGDVEAVSDILADPRAVSIGGVDLVDGWGMRAVHYAAAAGQLVMMKYLVDECKAQPNPRTEENPESDNFQICEKRTPLHFAAINSHDAVCHYLGNKLVNASLKDVHGNTPKFYAKDSDLKRFLKKAEESYFHLQFSNKVLYEILMQKQGDARPPMVSESGRVILTYKEMNKDIARFNKKTGNDLPKHGIPGQSAVMRMIKMMNDDNHKNKVNGGILGIMNSSADPKYPMPVFCRFNYTTYLHEATVWITEFFVTPGLRRDRNGHTLLLHTLLHAVQGSFQIKKAVAIVHDENYMGRGFFETAGFSKEPAYRVVRKFRKPESQTYVCNDLPSACNRLSKMLVKWLKTKDAMKAEEFKLSEVRDAEEEAKYAKKTAKDYDMMQQKLDLLYNPPLPRFKAPHLALQGGPLVDISNQPSRATSQRKLAIGITENSSDGENESKNGEWFTCDVDRVTADMSNMYRSQILRARSHSEWLNRKENRRKGNSRLFNLQGPKMSEWMEHLDGLEDRGLPRGWASYKDAGDNDRVKYINMKTEERATRRPVSSRTDSMRQASERQAIESKRKLGDTSRPRSATPGTLLIVKEPEYEGPGSAVAMEKFPFLELTGNKEEEEAEEKKMRAKERVKFEKTFNRLIDTATTTLINLDQFQKVCYREWGNGSKDAETAIERARRILPPGPPPAKIEHADAPAGEHAKSSESSKPMPKDEETGHPSSSHLSGGNGGLEGGKEQNKISSLRATSTSGGRQATPGKSIRFDHDDKGHDQGVSSSSGQTIRARPNSATVSAGSFGAASLALFSASDTRRQRIRSPHRGQAEPLSRSVSPQRLMTPNLEFASETASSRMLPAKSSVTAVPDQNTRPMSGQLPLASKRPALRSVGAQEVTGPSFDGEPASHLLRQATSVIIKGSRPENVHQSHRDAGGTGRLAMTDMGGRNVKIASHAEQAAADWVAIASEREQALLDADSFLDLYAPPPRPRPADNVKPPPSSPETSADNIENRDDLLESLEQYSLFRRPSSGAAHAHVRAAMERTSKDSSRASSAAPSRPKTSASAISLAETRAASEYSWDLALASKVGPTSDYSRPPSSQMSRAASVMSFGSDLDASRPTTATTTAARDASRPTTAARDVSRPTTAARDVSRPTTAARDVSRPATAARDVSRPATAARDVSRPTTAARDVSRPATASSRKSKADAAAPLDEGVRRASGYEHHRPVSAIQASSSSSSSSSSSLPSRDKQIVRPASAVPFLLPPLQEDVRASDVGGSVPK